jgi:hypothetical protein
VRPRERLAIRRNAASLCARAAEICHAAAVAIRLAETLCAEAKLQRDRCRAPCGKPWPDAPTSEPASASRWADQPAVGAGGRRSTTATPQSDD